MNQAKDKVSCQACGYEVPNSVHCSGGRAYQAKPGDLSICLNCGTLGIFTPEMALRAPWPQECGNMSEDVLAFQFAIRYRGLLKRPPGAKN